jgi:SAM-dependent methyltransferase
MTIQPYDLAYEEWTTDAGGQNLINLWNDSQNKRVAVREALVGGLLVMFCGDARRVVDLGCGPARYVPVCREYLPKFSSYAGYDISERMMAEAVALYGGEAGVTIEERDIFAGAPYTKAKRPDVLLSIDTSRHYLDPMGLLKSIVKLWPARAYLFSVLYGAPAELINGQVVGHDEMVAGLAECGEVLGYQEIALEPGMAVRYVVVKGA